MTLGIKKIPTELAQLSIQVPCPNNLGETVNAEVKAAKIAKDTARK